MVGVAEDTDGYDRASVTVDTISKLHFTAERLDGVHIKICCDKLR